MFLKNVMEYSLPEVTIGAKWECVWNDNHLINSINYIIFYKNKSIPLVFINKPKNLWISD